LNKKRPSAAQAAGGFFAADGMKKIKWFNALTLHYDAL